MSGPNEAFIVVNKIKEWMKEQKVGYRSFRIWEKEDNEHLRIQFMLPNAVSGPWPDFLASIFHRSGLAWRDHLGDEPICKSYKLSGKGQYRVITILADRHLTKQIYDRIIANDGDKACFPALDAILEAKIPMESARIFLGLGDDSSEKKDDGADGADGVKDSGDDSQAMDEGDPAKEGNAENEYC